MVLRGEGKPAVIPDEQMARFRLCEHVPHTSVLSMLRPPLSHFWFRGWLISLLLESIWGKWELRLLFLSSKKFINGVIAAN